MKRVSSSSNLPVSAKRVAFSLPPPSPSPASISLLEKGDPTSCQHLLDQGDANVIAAIFSWNKIVQKGNARLPLLAAMLQCYSHDTLSRLNTVHGQDGTEDGTTSLIGQLLEDYADNMDQAPTTMIIGMICTMQPELFAQSVNKRADLVTLLIIEKRFSTFLCIPDGMRHTDYRACLKTCAYLEPAMQEVIFSTPGLGQGLCLELERTSDLYIKDKLDGLGSQITAQGKSWFAETRERVLAPLRSMEALITGQWTNQSIASMEAALGACCLTYFSKQVHYPDFMGGRYSFLQACLLHGAKDPRKLTWFSLPLGFELSSFVDSRELYEAAKKCFPGTSLGIMWLRDECQFVTEM